MKTKCFMIAALLGRAGACLRIPLLACTVLMVARVWGVNIDASLELPDGRAPTNTPQMVLITFDDYIDDEVESLVSRVFDGRSNPNGSPVQATFFVMTYESDFWQIHNIHSRGHEIGVHSMTHSTSTNTTAIEWRRELEGCRETISRLASVPIGDIRGSRAPYLQYNPGYFESLHLQGFLYDASVTDFPNASGSISTNQGNVVWPYTLHDGFHQPVWGGEPPTNDLPGLFVLPMWTMGDSLEYADVMDPEGDHDEVFALLSDHLDQRYAGNRAPLGVWLHAKWLEDEEHISALEDFIDYALGIEDVWIVSMGDAIDFMRDLPTMDELDDYPPFNPEISAPIPRASGAECLASDAPPEVYLTRFWTTGYRPLNYPTPDNAFHGRRAVPALDVRAEVTNYWGSGGDAVITISNRSAETVFDWELLYRDPPSGDGPQQGLQGLWGRGRMLRSGDLVRVVPNETDSGAEPFARIAPGEAFELACWFSGSEDYLDSGLEGALGYVPDPALPEFAELTPTASGWRARWNRSGLSYRLLHSGSPAGPWSNLTESVQTEAEWASPDEAQSSFYRIEAVR